jgi:hypothetical protein
LPSGAYLAKKLLQEAAAGSGQWWWDAVLQAGGVLTSSYVVLVLAHALRRAGAPVELKRVVPRFAQAAALALAVCSLLLAAAALGPVPPSLVKNPLALDELMPALLTVLAGGALAFGLGYRPPRSARDGALSVEEGAFRRAALVVGASFVRADGVLRRWPVAATGLLVVAAAFGWMLAAAP